MMSKLLIVMGVAIAGLITACSVRSSLGTGAQPMVKASPVPQITTFPRQLPATRPSALPVPTLIPPVGELLSEGVGDRPDPFSALSLTPTVVIKQNPVPVSPSVSPPVSPVAPAIQPFSNAVAQQSSPLPTVLPTIVVPATAPLAIAPSSSPLAMPTTVLPSLPAASPSLNLAQAIAVSGVVQAGNRTSVIVQVPNETSSRYAVVGDYLANGKVLVKRIEMQGAEPLVVLEQDGAEFIKPVGSGSLGTL